MVNQKPGKSLYKELIKSFFLSFKRLSLYSVDHPLSKEILHNLFTMFDALLKEEREILVVIGVNADEMLVNQEVLDHEVMGVAELYEKFRSFKLDGIGFSQGLTLAELVDFVEAMAAAATLYRDRAETLPVLLREGSEHIKIRKVHYEKVEEGEKVVSGDTEPAGAGIGAQGGVAGSLPAIPEGEDVFGGIRDFLTGKTSEMEGKAAQVLQELDKNVGHIAEAIIESARACGDFESVIKKFVVWLSKHITPGMVEKKRDPSRFIEKLFDSFRKEEFGIPSSQKETIIEECADDIKTAMVEEAFSVYRTSAKKGLGLATKILADEEDQKRILPGLSGKLVDYGVQEDEAKSFVQQVEAELSQDEAVTISKKKLDRLLKVSERYEQELNRQVRVATEELTKMNKHLADEKERSEGIMHLLSDGLVVVDKSGKIMMMNPAAEKLLGKEMKETVGKSLVEGLNREHLLAMAKGALKGESRFTKEIELNSKDETTKRVLRASSAVVENEDGKTIGMVSVLSDITREKEVDEMKTHFISLVTHELRTPVVAVQKSLDLILSRAAGAINEDQEKFLSISKFNLERLNRLINDLLDLSKLEAGKFIVQPTQFDFRDVIKEVKASLMSWITDKEINVRMDLKDEPVIIQADRDRMMQVIVNLIGNALKFTPAKGEISVVLTPLEQKEGICSQSCIEVAVADTGIGIDPKDFKRIFNKFEQVSLVSPSGVGGTGLGLPIAKEIIHLHGGQIWVESQQGKGSRFIFVIPRIFQSTKKEA